MWPCEIAGWTDRKPSLNFTVLNQPPTARISVDGRVFSELGQLTVDENGGWEINGNLSTDNEPVDYLWVINDDRSWRGWLRSIRAF